MKCQPYLLHALSPLHAGVGQAAELIDLPIARLKGSGIPFVPGSSVKGVLRDACDEKDKVEAVFGPGPEPDKADKFAGALVCTDARLLALPVRSFRGTFAFVTCPLLLTLAARDIPGAPNVPPVPESHCIASEKLVFDSERAGQAGAPQRMVYLEDLDLTWDKPEQDFVAWCTKLGDASGLGAMFTDRFAVVDDETMSFLWETATQLDQRVRITSETRTVAKGALWLEESLPPETLLLGLLLAEKSRNPELKQQLSEQEVMEVALPAAGERNLQFGGKSTVGRGRCRMVWVQP